MADTSNLSNFLGDVADAIRTKKGTTETIPAANFDTEIASIETGSDTSDATATENDILAGTTAYIADGKVEGNIQKIEEALDDTVVSSEIECGYDSSYSSGFNALAYCKRHNLLVRTNGHVINLNTGEHIGSVNNYDLGEFSYVDSGDNKVMFYVSKKYDQNTVIYFYEIDISSSSVTQVNTVTIGGNYNYTNIIPNPNSPNSCYVVRGNYNYGNIYSCDVSGSISELATINTTGGIYAFYNCNISLQYNLSNTKLLIQSSGYRDNYMKYICIFNLLDNSCVSFASYSNNKYHDCTWYNDDTLLVGNRVCELTSSGLSTVKTLTNLTYTDSEDIVHYKDTNLFVRSSYSGKQIIAQVIDYELDSIISEEIVYSGAIRDFGNAYIKFDNNSVYSQASYTEDSITKYKLIEVGIGAEKQITGLIRNGTQYHDTSRGNAKSGDILKGTTAYSSNGKLIGSMPNNGAINITPSTEAQSIPAGYTSGGTVSAIDYSNTLSPTEYDDCLQLSKSILNDTKPYIELAYIESSGTQYINTEYNASVNTKIMMSVMTTDSRVSSGLYAQITGAKNSYHSSSAIQVAHGLNDNMVIIDYGTNGSNNQQIIPRNTKMDIIVGNNVSSVNGQMYSQTGSFSGTCSYPLWIFDCNSAGSHEQYYIGRVYYYKIYENDTLVRDFIPVKNILNNEICLYDKIESKFYYNSGSGNFIGGGN